MPPRRSTRKKLPEPAEPAAADDASHSRQRPRHNTPLHLPNELKDRIISMLLEKDPNEDSSASQKAYARLALLNKEWRAFVAPRVYARINLRLLPDVDAARRCAAALPGALPFCQYLAAGRTEAPASVEVEIAHLALQSASLSSLAGCKTRTVFWAFSETAVEYILGQLGCLSSPPTNIAFSCMESKVSDVHWAAAFAFRRLTCLELRSVQIGQKGAINTMVDTLASLKGLNALYLKDVVLVGTLSEKVLEFGRLQHLRCEGTRPGAYGILEPIISRYRETLCYLVLAGTMRQGEKPHESDQEESDEEDSTPIVHSNELQALAGAVNLLGIGLQGVWIEPNVLTALRHCAAELLTIRDVATEQLDAVVALRKQSPRFWRSLKIIGTRSVNFRHQHVDDAIAGPSIRLNNRYALGMIDLMNRNPTKLVTYNHLKSLQQ